MKFPQTMRTNCPNCKKHTMHTVEQAKKKPRGALTHGQRIYKRKLKGYGSFPRPQPSYEKVTKKLDIRYKCTECGRKHMRGEGWRAKKFEIVKV